MLRAALVSAALSLAALPAFADARITVLMDLLKVGEVTEILRAEGLEYVRELDADMLQGQGGAFFAVQTDQIYDTGRIAETVRQALEAGLSDADLDALIAWYSTATGARIVDLENAARSAISDPSVEEAARADFEARADADDPHVALVRHFVEDNDLLTRNVSGAMTSNYRFFTGLADGRFYEQSEEQILAEVYAQRDEIREDTESWLNGYLLMAYQPLSLAEFEAYVAFSASPAGQSLNAALFDGFETVYRDISYALGRAVALSARGSDI